MQLVTCTFVEGSIRFGEYSRNLGPGAVLDLDEVVGQMPAVKAGDQVVTPARPVLVRDLLEGRLDAFVPVEPPASASHGHGPKDRSRSGGPQDARDLSDEPRGER